jgi:hypothetical protein
MTKDMKMRTVVAVGLAALVSVWGGASYAQKGGQKAPKDEAKAQFDVGVELFEGGQFEKAAVAFARAYELRPSFKITYLVARCESELGHYAASLEAFNRYLAEGGDKVEKARRDEVEKEIERLSSLVGSIAVETDADGATVFVDERRVGDTPLPDAVFVDLGEHEVLIKRGAVELHREMVKVAGGQRIAVTAKIGAGEEKPAADLSPDPSPTSGRGEQEAKGPGGGEVHRLWTWVAAGVGGAAAIAAGVTGGLSLSKANDVKDQCQDGTCPASQKDERDSALKLGYASDALIAVAGVGVAAGVVLFFMEPRWAKRESAVEVAPVAAPTADGGAFALVGRF